MTDAAYLPVTLNYEGLNELARALRETDKGLLEELRRDLAEVGDIVRDESQRLFTGGVAASAGAQTAAEHFDTRVRVGGRSQEIVSVGQSLRKTTGRRPDWGARQVTEAFLPARDAKLAEAARILDEGAGRLLRQHGF